MEFWKCDDLGLSFKEQASLMQQKFSEEYKNLLHLNDVSNERLKRINPPHLMHKIKCSPCKISISGWDNYQTHVNSLEHAVMVRKKNTSFQSSYVASTFDLKTQRNRPTKTVVPAFFRRFRKQFSGPENYDHHLESTDHRKKCGPSTQILQNDETDSIVIKDNMNDILPNYPQSSVSTSKVRETLPELFVKCDMCEIEFSGAVPYLIHLVSNGHKMKASNRQQSEFKCDICVMTFTGDLQYEKHLVSNGHNQNFTPHLFKQHSATGALSPLDSSMKDSYIADEQASVKDLQEWYCDVCKIQCSGSIPYNTHIIGQEHLENIKIMLLEENFRKIM